MYPLSNIIEILDQLGSTKYFSIFYLTFGFHQISMHQFDEIFNAENSIYNTSWTL